MKRSTQRTRRAILATTTSLAIVGTAGCTGETEDTDTAEDELDQAADYLEENGDLLDEYDDATSVSTSESSPEFDHATFEQNIDLARTHLDNAEDAAPDTYGDDIVYFHTVIDYQIEIGEYNALIEDYLQCLDTMDALITADRWEDAADQHDDCVEVLRDIDTQLETSIDYLDEIDRSEMSDEVEIEYEATEGEIAVAQAEIPPMFDFHEGMQFFFDGIINMLDAIDQFDDGETNDASLQFYQAEGEFSDAESIYYQLERDPELPDGLTPDVIEMHCFMSAFEEAAGHWYNAVEAYENGNESRYNNELDAVDAALARCE